MDELRKGYWVPLNGVVERPQYRPGVFGGRMDVYIVPCSAVLVVSPFAAGTWPGLIRIDSAAFLRLCRELNASLISPLFSISLTEGDVVAMFLKPSCPL